MESLPTKVELIWNDEEHEASENDCADQPEVSQPEFDDSWCDDGDAIRLRRRQLEVFAFAEEFPPLSTIGSETLPHRPESSMPGLDRGLIPLPFDQFLTIERIFFMLNDQREKTRSAVRRRIPFGLKDNCFLLIDNSDNVARQKQNARLVFEDDRGAWKTTNRTCCYYLIRKRKLTLVHRRGNGFSVRRAEGGRHVYIPIVPTPPEELVIKVGKYYTSQDKYVRRITWIENEGIPNPRAVVEYKGTFTAHRLHGNCKRKREAYVGKLPKVTRQIKKTRTFMDLGRPRQKIATKVLETANPPHKSLAVADGAEASAIRHGAGKRLKNVHLTIHTDDRVLSTQTFEMREDLVDALCSSEDQKLPKGGHCSVLPFQIVEKLPMTAN